MLEKITELESSANVPGFTRVRDELAKLSSKKSKLDSTKMATLEELSELVKEINIKVTEKKSDIAPKSSQLKKMRVKISKQEEIITEKQSLYDAKVSNIKKEVDELNIQESSLADHLEYLAARKDELEDLLQVANEHMDLLKIEKKRNSVKNEESLNTLKENLKRKQFELETKLKLTVEHEMEIKEYMAPNKKHVASYTAFSKLLELKLSEAESILNQSDDGQGTENRMII